MDLSCYLVRKFNVYFKEKEIKMENDAKNLISRNSESSNHRSTKVNDNYY